MTEKAIKEHGVVYICDVCGLSYKDKSRAEECEAWCRERKSCNLEIIKDAIPGLVFPSNAGKNFK